jgi:hypothetical protein
MAVKENPMGLDTVVFLGPIVATIAWAGTLAFVLAYAIDSPWRSSLVGRTMMYRAGSMLVILSYILVSKWFDLTFVNQYVFGLGIYVIVALTEWRLFAALRFAQRGRVTADHPNYSPVLDRARAFWKCVRARLSRRSA